jgi:multiple sugar transport system ATP-binding protein
MSVVEVRNVSKRFGEVTAVNNINLEIKTGEFLVILGPSGCGKTTTMRMIAGLEQPSDGAIWIAGKNVNGLPPRLRNIAMVFQSYALYPHMTVFNNIAFPLKAQFSHLSREERAARVEKAAKMVDIVRLLKRKPRQLSGGERQRVAIARALVTEPTVLLLDEPLSNLDAKLRASARDELKDFQRALGITTIFVTHDQIEAMGLGDRIVVMSHGEIQQVGTPQYIYDEPENEFVATFLGSPSMNLLEHEAYQMGFRPEHFVPKEEIRGESNVQTLTYYVKRVEYLGSDRLLYGHVRGWPEDHDHLILAKLSSSIGTPIDVDTDYEFGVATRHMRYFDKDAGGRIIPPEPLKARA